MAAKKEQTVIRVVLKCIKEYKLDSDFRPHELKKRLEQLDKVKIRKKKAPASPEAKKTRASTSGPIPSAKAKRSTNAYVSSFPSLPTYVQSPPLHTQYPPSLYQAVTAVYENRSPSCVHSLEPLPPTIMGSYPVSLVSFPAYAGNNEMVYY